MIRWHISDGAALVLQDDIPEGDRMTMQFPSFGELARFTRDLNVGALAAANRAADRDRDNAFVKEFPRQYAD